MTAPLFSQNFSNLTDQAVHKGKPVDQGTLGKFAPANADPEWYKKPFVSDLYQQPDSKGFYQQGYDDKSAAKTQNFINSLGTDPSWSEPNTQTWSKGFLSKYMVDNGLVPQDQKVSQATIAGIQSQQPGDINASGTLASDKMKYPGASGPSIT